MNPVLLKELRQSVRNRYVLTAYIAFIVILLVVAGVQVSVFTRNAWERPQSVYDAGKTLFTTIHGIFAGLAMLFVPCYTANRIVRERWGTDTDLMYVTPMPPAALLNGKFVSAMAMAGLFLAGALPFLALSYFIGGIDVLSIVMSVLLTLLAVAVLTLLTILLAIAPMPRIIRGVVSVGLGLNLLMGIGGWITLTSHLCSEGYMSILCDTNPCIVFVEAIAATVSAAALLYAAALAGFRSANLDRMRPFRVLATALIAAWGIVTALQSRYDYFEDAPKIWVTLLMLFAAGMMVLGQSERTAPGPYLRAQLPKSLAARARGFLFRTGQANAVCWAALLLAVGLMASQTIFKDENYDFAVHRKVHVFVLNISGYALTMLAFWRPILCRKMSNAPLWWVTALLIALITAILGPMHAGGFNGIALLPGYLFADSAFVLPMLYTWNITAFAICCIGILAKRDGVGK